MANVATERSFGIMIVKCAENVQPLRRRVRIEGIKRACVAGLWDMDGVNSQTMQKANAKAAGSRFRQRKSKEITQSEESACFAALKWSRSKNAIGTAQSNAVMRGENRLRENTNW